MILVYFFFIYLHQIQISASTVSDVIRSLQEKQVPFIGDPTFISFAKRDGKAHKSTLSVLPGITPVVLKTF